VVIPWKLHSSNKKRHFLGLQKITTFVWHPTIVVDNLWYKQVKTFLAPPCLTAYLKRLVWIRRCYKERYVKVPEYHCWRSIKNMRVTIDSIYFFDSFVSLNETPSYVGSSFDVHKQGKGVAVSSWKNIFPKIKHASATKTMLREVVFSVCKVSTTSK